MLEKLKTLTAVCEIKAGLLLTRAAVYVSRNWRQCHRKVGFYNSTSPARLIISYNQTHGCG